MVESRISIFAMFEKDIVIFYSLNLYNICKAPSTKLVEGAVLREGLIFGCNFKMGFGIVVECQLGIC